MSAAAAADHFRRVVQERERPAEIPRVTLDAPSGSAGLLDALRAAFALPSNGEARRLIAQGAVQIDDAVERDPNRRLAPGVYVLKGGKRRYAEVEVRP